MPQQTIGFENYEHLDGSDLSVRGIDQNSLNPVDFYWHQMAEAEGKMGQAAYSINSEEDAIRFLLGMQEELIESGEEPKKTTLHAISYRVIRALNSYLSYRTAETEEPDGDPDSISPWGTAVDAIKQGEIADRELIKDEEQIIRELTENIKQVREAKAYLKSLTDHLRQEAIANFSLRPEELEELELMAKGAKAKDRAKELGIETQDVSDKRYYILGKLKAKTQAHAVRIALETGVISLDEPVSDSPSVTLIPRDQEILDLHSRGNRPAGIGEAQERSPKAVRTKIQTMVGRLGAKSRQNLVYRAIEEGIIPIESNELFHLFNALNLHEAAEVSLVFAKTYLEDFVTISGAQAKTATPALTEYQAGIGDYSPNGERARIDNAKLKEPTNMALENLKKINDGLFDLIAKAYERIILNHPSLLSEEEKQELEYTARGITITQRSNGNDSKRTGLSKARSVIVDKLKAKSIQHSVTLAIAKGLLPVEWARRYEEPTIPESAQRILDIISLITDGAEGNEIKSSLGFSKRVLETDVAKAYEALGASDWASLIYRAFEKGLIIPATPNAPLHRAALAIERAERGLDSASTFLSGIDPTELNRYSFGLTETDLVEIEAGAHGITLAERVKAGEQITQDVLDTRRQRMEAKLQVDNLNQATYIAIMRGVITFERSERSKDRKSSRIELSEEKSDLLEEVAQGGIMKEIAARKGQSRWRMAENMREIRSALSAKNTPHAIFRAFEEGVFSLD